MEQTTAEQTVQQVVSSSGQDGGLSWAADWAAIATLVLLVGWRVWDSIVTRLGITFWVWTPTSVSGAPEFPELGFRVVRRSKSPVAIEAAYLEYGDGEQIPPDGYSGPLQQGVPVYYHIALPPVARILRDHGYSGDTTIKFVLRLGTGGRREQPVVIRGLDSWIDNAQGPAPTNPLPWYSRLFRRLFR